MYGKMIRYNYIVSSSFIIIIVVKGADSKRELTKQLKIVLNP
jgi:hypothetical protein